MSDEHLKPGSPEAIAKGCTCDPKRNADGAGHDLMGRHTWFPANDCRMHGLAAALDAVRSGKVRVEKG
jgi:hypothetical protein